MNDLIKLTVDELREIVYDQLPQGYPQPSKEEEALAILARRAQANDALRLAAQEAVYQGLTERDNGVIELTPGEPLRARLLVLRNALAAAPAPSSSGAPAPADSQREAAIEASPYDALGHAMEILAGTPYTGEMASKVARVLRQWSDKWAAAVDLTCPAPPAPVAPVTEGEVEAAIMDMFAKCKLYGWTDGREYPVAAESEAAVAARDALCALIARRVAEARGAGLREFKAWFAEKATWTIEATAEAPAVRGFSVAPRDIDVQIDRLLAAPPARKLAEEPAQEDDGPCLSALLANMRMEMSDGANGMRTPREEAIAAVVECVARRIEALENNKEAGK